MKKITFNSTLCAFFVFITLFSIQPIFSINNPSSTTTEGEEDLYACTGSVVNTFPYVESFENNTGAWTQNSAPDDDANWSFDPNTTGTTQTGPDAPSNGTYYLYFETSNPVANFDTAILTSPCIDLTSETSAFFSFDYHMHGANMGDLDVEISSDAGGSWTNVFTRSGEQHADETSIWLKEDIDLSAYLGNTINIRFVGTKGNSFRSDMAIDNVRIDTYCTSDGSIDFTNGITNVDFNTISNPSSEAPSYTNFLAVSTDVTIGDTHTLTVNLNTLGANLHETRAWIDWNQNNDFTDAGEEYDLGSDTNLADQPMTITPNILIPSGAAIGATRMRVSTVFGGTIPTPCLNEFLGEVEDYTINVLSGVPQSEINITGLGNSIISGNVTSPKNDTDFGTITVWNSNENIFTIENTGDLDLKLTGAPLVSITGTGSS